MTVSRQLRVDISVSITPIFNHYGNGLLIVLPLGLEHPSQNPKKKAIADQGGAESGALDAQTAPMAPELATIIEAWADLPDAVKAGILAMVRTTRK